MAPSLRSIGLHLASAVQLFSILSADFVAALPGNGRPVPRASSAKASNSTYDYVIVGGGLTGLVVANRLTENPDVSVLVIEYGYIDNGPATLIPYYANSLNTADMWSILSAPATNLNNASFPVWVGAVVGGGSVVNGMEYDRGSSLDYDSWESLGNSGWGWSGLLPYFKKSTTFTPPSAQEAAEFGITYDASVYGNGPLQTSFSTFQYPDLKTLWAAWCNDGVALPKEGAAGDAVGAFWTPSTIDQKTVTRSHARNAYYDPVSASRPNLHLMTGQTVNKILLKNLVAQGVQMVSRADNSTTEVYASKEVILAAGAIHTPQLLQLSGVGPSAVLKAAGIKVQKDFPAVGANFQDHPAAYLAWNLTNTSTPNPNSLLISPSYNASAYQQYVSNKTGPYAAARGNSAAFLSLPELTTSFSSIVSSISAQSPKDHLPAIYSNSVLLKGFKAQRKLLLTQYSGNESSVSEFPFNGGGRSTAALQKPLSRGTVTLNPSNPQGQPIVQYNTLQNPADASILVAMVKHARSFWARPEVAKFSPVEATPGAQYQTDDEILSALKNGVLQPSFAHPSCSCAMMPEDMGGCVSDQLLVYGMKNLSIVDASILPMIPGAHLQATMYAVAEKAADLIKARQ